MKKERTFCYPSLVFCFIPLVNIFFYWELGMLHGRLLKVRQNGWAWHFAWVGLFLLVVLGLTFPLFIIDLFWSTNRIFERSAGIVIAYLIGLICSFIYIKIVRKTLLKMTDNNQLTFDGYVYRENVNAVKNDNLYS